MPIKFKPHHFLCTLGFQGSGYDEAFIENYWDIFNLLNNLNSGDLQQLQVTFEADSICAPCPHRRTNLCQKQEKITELDKNHAHVLGLKNNQIITWGEAKELIIKNIDPDVHDRICKNCKWKKYGFCLNALNKLRNSTK